MEGNAESMRGKQNTYKCFKKKYFLKVGRASRGNVRAEPRSGEALSEATRQYRTGREII